jgi:insertion element IS1 protein InsB
MSLGVTKMWCFLKLNALLVPFGITQYYTDHWGADTRHCDADEHQPGKRNTQKLERKHLMLHTRIKRLVRKTICFSKSIQIHDIVIGLFVNRYEFGLNQATQHWNTSSSRKRAISVFL